MRWDLLFFDLDGTLADPHPCVIPGRGALCVRGDGTVRTG